MEILEYICFGNHPNGHLNKSSEIGHWIGDALRKDDAQAALEDMDIVIYGGYEYAETEDDPFWE